MNKVFAFGLIFVLVSVFFCVLYSPNVKADNTNLASISSAYFWTCPSAYGGISQGESTSTWSIDSPLAVGMDVYPVTYGGYSNCIEMVPNPYYVSTPSAACTCAEMDGGYVSVSAGDVVVFSAWIWTTASNVANTAGADLMGCAVEIDPCGASGRLCSIDNANGLETYPNYPSDAGTAANWGSGGWVFCQIVWTVPAKMEADPWDAIAGSPYTAGQMVPVTGCIPLIYLGTTNPSGEKGTAWIYDTVVTVTP